MRTDKELLQILLDNIRQLRTGLCYLAKILKYDGIIDHYEYQRLIFIIDNNIPDYDYYVSSGGFYFAKGLQEPRIKYLKTLIIKYS